jgi:hypothetical protein
VALKYRLKKDEHGSLTDELKKLYVEKDGVFVLEVTGAVDEDEFEQVNAKLTEFLDNNRKLFNDLKKFEGVDVDEFKRLKDSAGKGGDPKDVEKQIAAAVDKATQSFDQRVKAIETERDEAKRQLNEKALDDALWEIGQKSIRESARPDFLRRARDLFRYEDGKVVAKKGDDPVYSKRRGHTTEPLSIEEYVVDADWLQKDADHLYKQSRGTDTPLNKGTTVNGARVIANDPMITGQALEEIAKGTAVVSAG